MLIMWLMNTIFFLIQLVLNDFQCQKIEMLLGDMRNEVEIKWVGKERMVHDKKCLISVDVVNKSLINKRDELQEFLGRFFLRIFHCLALREFTRSKSLRDHWTLTTTNITIL